MYIYLYRSKTDQMVFKKKLYFLQLNADNSQFCTGFKQVKKKIKNDRLQNLKNLKSHLIMIDLVLI